MDPGGAGVSREFSRRARWGRVSEVRMLDAVIHAMDERALRTTIAVVDHCRPSGNLTRPITTMGAVAASATPATNRVRRQNHTLGFIGRPASHTAPGPSKQNALTPKSKALPAAIRPGSNAMSESWLPASHKATAGIKANKTRPRLMDGLRHSPLRSIRTAIFRGSIACGVGRCARTEDDVRAHAWCGWRKAHRQLSSERAKKPAVNTPRRAVRSNQRA